MGPKETFRCWLVGCKPVSSLPQGGRHRKAQALPLFKMARNQTADSGGLQKVGAKSENVKKRRLSGKGVLSRMHSVKVNGTGVISV